MIQFLNVSKVYPGGQVALDGVTFTIETGEFVMLTGVSGAGKTSLLKAIFREDVPTEGRILVNGRNVSSLPAKKIPFLRREIGVVFQDFRLIHRKTIFENVAYLPRILGMTLKERKLRVEEALRNVGLADRAGSLPDELSGGEKQRVAIARALVNSPQILLADEPTGNLDPELSLEIFQLFQEINQRSTTVLAATHDPTILEEVPHRRLVLDRGRLISDAEHRPRKQGDAGISPTWKALS